MREKFLLLLSLILLFTLPAGCGAKDEPPAETGEGIQTSFRYEACGLAYELPAEWMDTEGINIIPVSYVEASGNIYAKIEYNFIPDENMEELNNENSEIPVDELMFPVFSMIVVREENFDTEEVQAELDKYDAVEELEARGGFRFFYMTDYTGAVRMNESSAAIFEEMRAGLPAIRQSIETFEPDESAITSQLEDDKQYLNFMSTTIDGENITSTVYYDYNMTVINFWASYCMEDINELESLQSFYEELQDKHPDVNFLQVIIDGPDDDIAAAIQEAYNKAGVTFTGLFPDANMGAWILENINGLPTTIFVDSTGKTSTLKLEGVQDTDYYMEVTEGLLDNI